MAVARNTGIQPAGQIGQHTAGMRDHQPQPGEPVECAAQDQPGDGGGGLEGETSARAMAWP